MLMISMEILQLDCYAVPELPGITYIDVSLKKDDIVGLVAFYQYFKIKNASTTLGRHM